MKLINKIIFLGLVFGGISCSEAPQQADPDFIPLNTIKTFTANNSPVVLVDEAHNNFLTMNGRYLPFAKVLLSDGYTVQPNRSKFSIESLKHADILVVANALDRQRKDWLPPYGNALDKEEVFALKKWVMTGGSLFLVADHNPFPKVIEELALAFGFRFTNGHIGNAMFFKRNYTLSEHAITIGKTEQQNEANASQFIHGLKNSSLFSKQINQVKSFGGSAFKAPESAISLLTLGERAVSVVPEIPFQVNNETPRIPVNGWSQGAILEIGKGRVAVFSEGMMFSSQVVSKTGGKYGLASMGAEQNEQFLLNVMHWLSGEL